MDSAVSGRWLCPSLSDTDSVPALLSGLLYPFPLIVSSVE